MSSTLLEMLFTLVRFALRVLMILPASGKNIIVKIVFYIVDHLAHGFGDPGRFLGSSLD